MTRAEYVDELVGRVNLIIDDACSKVNDETPEYYLAQAIIDELCAVKRTIAERSEEWKLPQAV